MAAGDWKDMLSAIHENDLTRVRYHVKSGVNINYQHPEFLTTVLIESISHERVEIMKFLLESGADPLLKAGFSSDDPIKIAFKTRNREIIELIQAYLPKKNSLMSLVDMLRLKIKI